MIFVKSVYYSYLLQNISKMCLDIEHNLKVRMLKDVENDSTTHGYNIVYTFLRQNNYIMGKLEATSASPFTSDLIRKFFTLQRVFNPQKGNFSCTQRNQSRHSKNSFYQ